MAKDYAAISKKIVENIGGVENIASVTHCMTRLRFVVKDEGKINDAAVKATDGVMGVVNQGGQYQIIIGNHVEEAYNEVLKMGALWPLLVITGMHRVFTPTILQTISETGMEGTVMPSEIGANLSLGGVSLAVAFKTKNSELRQTALAAASSALIAGTTEPALYGVAVRLKRPLIASLITGFVCGCLAGMAGLASRSMVSPSVLTGVQFIDPANPGVSIAWIAGISVLSIVLSFVLTLVIGFEDLPEEE